MRRALVWAAPTLGVVVFWAAVILVTIWATR
jgi:hypothetical protein